MPDLETHNKPGWTISKDIPIVFILTVLGALGGQMIYYTTYFTKMDSRIARLEEKDVDSKVANAKLLEMPDRLTRSEYETLGVKEGIKRLEAKIDQLQRDNDRRANNP